MKGGLLLAVLFLLVESLSFSQIYKAGDYSAPAETAQQNVAHRWELSVSGALNSSSLEDFSGTAFAKGQATAGARVMYAVADWFSVGAEAEAGFALQQSEILDSYHMYRAAAVGKFTLTPNASPRVYFLTGAGKQTQKMSYFLKREESFSSYYAVLGWGIEADFTPCWFGGMELRAYYDTGSLNNTYFYLAHRWTGALRLHTGLRF